MTASIRLNLAEGLGIAVRALHKLEQLRLLGFGEFSASLQEVFLELGESQGLAGGAHLVQRKYLIKIDVLRLAQSRHGLRVDKARQLERHVTFVQSIVLSFDSLQRLLVEVDNLGLVVLGHAFDSVVRNGADVFVAELLDVGDQGREGFARREQATDGVVDAEVGRQHTENLVAEVRHGKRMVDEEFAAHKLIDKVLLDQHKG